MKINQDFSVNIKPVQPEVKVSPQGTSDFKLLVQSQKEKLQTGQIQQLLSDIEKAGERLEKSKNFRDLAKYKSLIKRFVKETVDYGLNLSHSTTWDGYGQTRTLRIIKEIDEKLVQMTEELLEKEKENIHLLGLMGEIKGLLINLLA